MILQIDEQNWNISRYIEEDLMAFISMGAIPLENLDSIQSTDSKFIYSVIVSNQDYEEISDSPFDTLEEAIQSINQRFGLWKLTTLKTKSEGGCDSCAAH